MATHSSIPAWRIAQTEEGGHPEGRLRGAYCGLKVCVSGRGLGHKDGALTGGISAL